MNHAEAFEAYKGIDNKEHIVCTECPDAELTKQIVANMEWKREIDFLISGVIGYSKREIKEIICEKHPNLVPHA